MAEERSQAATDRALMRRVALKRDRRAFRSLVRRHLKRVHAVAFRVLGDVEAAEDVAQEVFLQVWRKAAQYSPERGAVSAWLARMAANAAIDRLRREGRTRPTADARGMAALPDPRPGPEQTLLMRERAALVRRFIGALPARQRLALSLAHDAGLGNHEIAKVMGTSVEAVESLLARARRRLRERLRPYALGGGTNPQMEGGDDG